MTETQNCLGDFVVGGPENPERVCGTAAAMGKSGMWYSAQENQLAHYSDETNAWIPLQLSWPFYKGMIPCYNAKFQLRVWEVQKQ